MLAHTIAGMSRPGTAPGETVPVWRPGDKPGKQKPRLAKVPKYEEPNSMPAAGLTGSSGGSFGSRYGHSADHHHAKPPSRLGAFVLRSLGLKPKPSRVRSAESAAARLPARPAASRAPHAA
jgi:hypothetical protein